MGEEIGMMYRVVMIAFFFVHALQAGNTFACLRGAVEEQIENGNAEKLAEFLVKTGLEKLDKNQNVEKFGKLTGLKAEVKDGSVQISSPTVGLLVSYTPDSDKDDVVNALVTHVIAAHAGTQA